MKSYLVVLAAIAGIAHANEHDPTCPQNGEKMEKGFDDAMRLKFLALHNGYRSRLALGHVSITEESEDYDLYDLLYAPTASKMRYLKYDCEAEKSAYESAKKCQTTASSWEKYDENLQVIEDPRDINHAALKAIISWATEAFNLNKTGEGVLYRSNHNISNFANLAWDTREKVGCAVVKCSPRTTHVVCHYPKIVKKEGKPIYITGKPCGGCGDYANKFFCHADEGVCIIASRDLDIYGRKKYFYPFREL
ncbi:SCP-like protein [Ancylostoma caninum]|uniref:SCP-like protein n=1 Tax=Ancylostoma caninum TaxID=29170 RepID=A0A368H392_ANCCA|nr:SCP-like protein [Ancylostoma caninum]